MIFIHTYYVYDFNRFNLQCTEIHFCDLFFVIIESCAFSILCSDKRFLFLAPLRPQLCFWDKIVQNKIVWKCIKPFQKKRHLISLKIHSTSLIKKWFSLATILVRKFYKKTKNYVIGITLNSNSYLGTYPFLPCSSLKVIGQLGSSICELDLSFCQLDLNLGPLEQLCGLQTLIMDNCKLTDRHCLPYLKHLQTLR